MHIDEQGYIHISEQVGIVIQWVGLGTLAAAGIALIGIAIFG